MVKRFPAGSPVMARFGIDPQALCADAHQALTNQWLVADSDGIFWFIH